MAHWREKLDIKQFLQGDSLPPDEPVPVELVTQVREEIKKSRLLPVASLLEELDYVATVEDFDNWLEELYNEADAKRVWLGL
jgi:hypothetical protein